MSDRKELNDSNGLHGSNDSDGLHGSNEIPEVQNISLKQTAPLTVTKSSFTAEAIHPLSHTDGTSFSLGEAAEVMEQMLRDENCLNVLTLSGDMTLTGLGDLMGAAIKRGWFNCIVSTGALVGHRFAEHLGLVHYRTAKRLSAEEYDTLKRNRVFATSILEQHPDELEEVIRSSFDKLFDKLFDEVEGHPIGSAVLLNFMGRELDDGGLLQEAAMGSVPVIIPAFTDSELGLDFAIYNLFRALKKNQPLIYDAFADLELFREICEEALAQGKGLGIFSLGDGVPRHWAQQVGYYIDVRSTHLKLKAPRIKFTYDVHISPAPVPEGCISDRTFAEGVSGSTPLPPGQGGRYAEVLLDPSVGWPLLAQTMIERGL